MKTFKSQSKIEEVKPEVKPKGKKEKDEGTKKKGTKKESVVKKEGNEIFS